MAWLSGWKYRRKITITENSGNNLTDYQVAIDLDSSNFDFSKANSDGSDIRFTDSDGQTLLNYWIESWDSANQTAKIWVKVPSIPASGSVDIYMYYGNASAQSESNPEAVFDFWDDFDDGTYTDKWDKVGDGNVNESGTEISIDISSYSTSIYSKSASYGVNTALRCKWRSSSVTLDYPGFGYGNKGSADPDIVEDSHTGHGIIIGKIHSSNNYVQGRQTNDGTNRSETDKLTDDQANYHIYEIRRLPDRAKFAVDDVELATLTSYYPAEDLYIGIGGHTKDEGGQSIADWIAIRKFADPEPSYVIGGEEASLKYWDGSAWQNIKSVKYWDGSAWQTVKAVYRWDGSEWVKVW